MQKLNNQQKHLITGGATKSSSTGYTWNKIAFAAIATSVSVSFVSNILNIINSTKQKGVEVLPQKQQKYYGFNEQLKATFF